MLAELGEGEVGKRKKPVLVELVPGEETVRSGAKFDWAKIPAVCAAVAAVSTMVVAVSKDAREVIFGVPEQEPGTRPATPKQVEDNVVPAPPLPAAAETGGANKDIRIAIGPDQVVVPGDLSGSVHITTPRGVNVTICGRGQNCVSPPQMQTCWDGSVIPVTETCPPRPVETPPEPPRMQTCWDGSVIPVTETCPPRVVETPPEPPRMQTCWDGSSIPADQTCPPRPVGPFIVFFDWDKDEITPQAAAILDNAAQAYQTTGQAQVMLAGHADRSGSDAYNVGLSQRRANNVRSYLAGRGVPDGSMTTEAFGESRPLVDTADGVREPQNRRVEITFGPGSQR